jgi:hypothetical protein
MEALNHSSPIMRVKFSSPIKLILLKPEITSQFVKARYTENNIGINKNIVKPARLGNKNKYPYNVSFFLFKSFTSLE